MNILRCTALAASALCLGIASCCPYSVERAQDYIGADCNSPLTQPSTAPSPNLPVCAPKVPASQPTTPLKLTVRQAVLMALDNNQALAVEMIRPQISYTGVQQQCAVFDPDLTATINARSSASQSPLRLRNFGHSFAVSAALTEFLPTGTTLGLTADTNTVPQDGSDFVTTRAGLTVTQALLRGFGPDVNLASLRQAKLDLLSSEYELRGFAQNLVAQTEEAYWDYVLAQQQIRIFKGSLELAEQQLRETDERIAVQKLAPYERVAAEAEVAQRREGLIDATSTLQTTRLRLGRLLSPATQKQWTREIITQSEPIAPALPREDVDTHVQLGLMMRPEISQAKLLIERDELEVVKTKNGLLPQLDLFANLGKTGFAGSFGGSVQNWGQGYDVLVGGRLEFPPLNRAARASYHRSMLTKQQATESLENLRQTVEVDVRTAYIELVRTAEQVTATAATRRLQETNLQVETEKYRLGRSTSLQVAQVQRDLLGAQINEVAALVNHIKAYDELYRLDGSLLERRGISAPAAMPAKK